jgi:hypothetical protein
VKTPRAEAEVHNWVKLSSRFPVIGLKTENPEEKRNSRPTTTHW